eukprot:11231200-Ditylum_brightwellii.AAC.1
MVIDSPFNNLAVTARPTSSPQYKVGSTKGATPLHGGHSTQPSTDMPKSMPSRSLKQGDVNAASNEDQKEKGGIQQRNLFSNDNYAQDIQEVHSVDHETLDMLS